MLARKPSDFGEIYSAYAAGCLDPAFQLLVETQAALRPDVRQAVAQAETIAGAFLEAEAATAVSDGVLDQLLSRIDGLDQTATEHTRAAERAGDILDEILRLPAPLRDQALEASMDRSWTKLAPGVSRLNLGVESSTEVELYRIEPGRTLPRHSHRGNELTLVVAGGFEDGTGHFRAGDLSVKGPQDVHQPTADSDSICFALAVRDAGLEFKGVFGLVQKMLRR
jgi:putative transcriptional regulator